MQRWQLYQSLHESGVVPCAHLSISQHCGVASEQKHLPEKFLHQAAKEKTELFN
jgi:hypothetical protein